MTGPKENTPQRAHTPEAILKTFGPPSENYKQAKGTGVYRLSELMFGSLLASYVLGFIGSSSRSIDEETLYIESLLQWILYGGRNDVIPQGVERFFHALDYLCISVTFAYLTATLYIAYHAGILPMFQLPLSRLRWDFIVSLSQAICFGIALIIPHSFLFVVSLTILTALWRQALESRALIRELIALHPPPDLDTPQKSKSKTHEASVEARKKQLGKKIRVRLDQERDSSRSESEDGKGNLRGWSRPLKTTWISTAGLCVFGFLLLWDSVQTLVRSGPLLVAPEFRGACHLAVAISLVWLGHKELASRGPLLVAGPKKEVMKELDESAELLARDLSPILESYK